MALFVQRRGVHSHGFPSSERRMELMGRRVRFTVRDIYYPAPETLAPAFADDEWLSGQIVDISDSGARAQAYVVVRADGVETLLVVAVERVHLEDG